VADGQAGFEALKIVEACYRSSQSGKRVEMKWGKNDVRGKELK
jgi:predicted dehydrogenase